MTAINHALTGTAIGLIIGEPLVAVPAAIVSHFVCDALPHFAAEDVTEAVRTKWFGQYLALDATLCFLLVLSLAFWRPQHWQLAAICAFLAAAPDLLWINKYLTLRNGKKWRRNAFSKFAGDIQWFQRPIGATVEAAWFIAAVAILVPFIK